jgi:enoyl-CoA hydratase
MESCAYIERRGHIAILTLNRPRQRNAVDPELTRIMNELVADFESDAELRVGVLTGAGETFCAGADLKAVAAGRIAEIVDVEPYGFAGMIRGNRKKPMVAAVNGTALAGGCELAIACDVVVAAESARFGLPEVTRGLIAGAGGLQRLPALIPPLKAFELILTGRSIDAAEAADLGMVNEVVAADQVLPRALEVAAAIAANAPLAVRESLAVARTAVAEGEGAAWRRSQVAWKRVLASPDAVEGSSAFAERRAPTWSS